MYMGMSQEEKYTYKKEWNGGMMQQLELFKGLWIF